jgi:hypothetical protein
MPASSIHSSSPVQLDFSSSQLRARWDIERNLITVHER